MEEIVMTRKYKIAKIIDEYQVVVNAGSNDLIHDDDCLEVYQPGQEVTDPDTGESLGTLDFVKAKLRVVNVFPKMCVCENRETEQKSFFSNISQGLFFEETLPMNVQTTDISGGYEGIDKKIKVGDLVRKVN
ncbi:hypothetical protein [Dysosmobacter welbionis]|jgi:hypothetical protein|uniref:hypothetical protein n=2 Tax=Oscillospiraceae TaxID=216572 RepID=UPI002943EDE4|nr:hypothetical protein [Dysosmobacter welbionis]